MSGLRIFKLAVLIGFPVLGALYAYQFSTPFDPSKRDFVVPFKVFKAPSLQFSLAKDEGGKVSESIEFELKAPVTVFNFWATWCPPCVEEFPAMIELQRKVADKGVELVFVSVDTNWSDVTAFYSKFNIELDPSKSLWDPKQEQAKAWGSVKFPETYVVRRDGWVVEKIIGAQQWTRPAIVEYFSNLGQKFSGIEVSGVFSILNQFSEVIFPNLWAQTSNKNDLPTSPMIHEQDKKQLEALRKNIETASQNVQKAQGAEKEEQRNLTEQRIVRDRKKVDLDSAQSEHAKVELKKSEVAAGMTKTRDALIAEQSEKRKVETEIRSLQDKIIELQNRLEATKDQLVQANKTLNTRVTSIENLEKAKESTQEELEEIQAKATSAKKVVDEKRADLLVSEKEVASRERKLSEIQKQVGQSEAVLEAQKKKLKQFEDLLKK